MLWEFLPLESHTDGRVDTLDVRFEGPYRHRAEHGLDRLREPAVTALGGAVP